MNRVMIDRIARGAAVCLLLLCVLILRTPAAEAAKTVYPPIWVECGKGENAQRVGLWEYGTNVTFFLPAGFDTKQMKLICSSPYDTVTVDGTEYHSGSRLKIKGLASKHSMKYGKTTYNLKFMQSSALPAVFLTTQSGTLTYLHENKHNKEAGTIRVFNEAGSLVLNSDLEHIKGRGNSTFVQPKRPYQIKFAQRTSLFGMAKAKKWILLANHKDKSLLRNSILFEAARQLDEKYPNHDQYVDLYINNQYLGNYELCEKVEVDKNRVSIRDLQEATEALNSQPLNSYKRFGSSRPNKSTTKGFQIPKNPKDITGGYLIVLEKAFHYPEDPNGFVTRRGICYIVKSPEYMSEKQAAYISSRIQRLEDAVYSKDGIDPETGKHFTEMADLDSMVREYLLEEVFKNYDVNRSSQYIVKPADSEGGLFYFGPSWDFDLSMGGWCDDAGNNHIVSPKRMLASAGTGWLPSLCKHTVFLDRVVTMYYEEFVPYLRALTGLKADGQTVPLLDRHETMKASAAMNFTRWPVLSSPGPVNTGTTYEANITYVNSWLIKRMDYLDTQWKDRYESVKKAAKKKK